MLLLLLTSRVTAALLPPLPAPPQLIQRRCPQCRGSGLVKNSRQRLVKCTVRGLSCVAGLCVGLHCWHCVTPAPCAAGDALAGWRPPFPSPRPLHTQACGGMLPWISWRYFLFGTATPGNGGPLMQPRGQTSVLYSVPPPLPPQPEQAEAAGQQQQQKAAAPGEAAPAAERQQQ